MRDAPIGFNRDGEASKYVLYSFMGHRLIALDERSGTDYVGVQNNGEFA